MREGRYERDAEQTDSVFFSRRRQARTRRSTLLAVGVWYDR